MKPSGIAALLALTASMLLSSCGSSPTAPGGRVLVYVTQDGTAPAPGKRIEIVGTSLRQSTNENGLALFMVRPGTHLVRAYELGTPGPSRPYLEQSVEVRAAQTSRAQFNDCRFCR